MKKDPEYCADCQLMLMETDNGCPKCGCFKRTTAAPPGKTKIRARGLTRFTFITDSRPSFAV